MHMLLCYFVMRVVVSTLLLITGIYTGVWLITAFATFGLVFNGTGLGVVVRSVLTAPPRRGTSIQIVPRKMPRPR